MVARTAWSRAVPRRVSRVRSPRGRPQAGLRAVAGEQLAEIGLVHQAAHRRAVMGQADQGAPGRQAGDEGAGPVDGVEHPDALGVEVLRAELLAEDAVGRQVAPDHARAWPPRRPGRPPSPDRRRPRPAPCRPCRRRRGRRAGSPAPRPAARSSMNRARSTTLIGIPLSGRCPSGAIPIGIAGERSGRRGRRSSPKPRRHTGIGWTRANSGSTSGAVVGRAPGRRARWPRRPPRRP